MEKIILRKDTLKRGHVNSTYISLTDGKKYSSEQMLLKDFSFQELMKKLFNEDMESNNLAESNLYKQYTELQSKNKGKDKWYKENDKFIELYKIDEEFALQLDFNIHLYHLIPKKEVYTQMVPWYYADSKVYVGDTWGEQDQEIIDSIKDLSIIEFLKRYKGY